MKTLMPILLFSLLMAFLSEKNSSYTIDRYGEKEYLHKDRLFYIVMTISMAVFVGLRTMGNDTGTYQYMYENTIGNLDALAHINWFKVSDAPGLIFITTLLRFWGVSTQNYFMLFAVFTVCVYLWFIRKYTSNILLSVYFFITMGVYTFTMAAIKQTTAVAFLLLATDCAMRGKKISFLGWVFIAELFHPYAFIYLIVAVLFFKPWTIKSYILLLGTVCVSMSLSVFIEGIFVMTDSMGYSYDANSFTGDGVNIFRVLVVWVPVLLSFLAQKFLKKCEDNNKNLILNMTMVNAMIMFLGLFGTANYFARLANYFLIFQSLALPWIFRFYKKSSRNLLVIGSVFCYAIYFYYQMVLAQGAFDNAYKFMGIWDYLGQLF